MVHSAIVADVSVNDQTNLRPGDTGSEGYRPNAQDCRNLSSPASDKIQSRLMRLRHRDISRVHYVRTAALLDVIATRRTSATTPVTEFRLFAQNQNKPYKKGVNPKSSPATRSPGTDTAPALTARNTVKFGMLWRLRISACRGRGFEPGDLCTRKHVLNRGVTRKTVVAGLQIENTTFEKHYASATLLVWGLRQGDGTQARQRRSWRGQDSDGAEEGAHHLQRP